MFILCKQARDFLIGELEKPPVPETSKNNPFFDLYMKERQKAFDKGDLDAYKDLEDFERD